MSDTGERDTETAGGGAAAGLGGLSGKTAWARNLAAPVRDFLSTETGGAAVLLVRDDRRARVGELALVGLLRVGLDDRALDPPRRRAASRMDLRHWVNEGLMTFFFLVVGLEAKRELDLGELRERRAHRDPGRWRRSAAWRCRWRSTWRSTPAAPARTAGARRCRPTRRSRSGCWRCVAPGGTRLRVRLLTLAVVDDLVALLVIATVYTEHVDVRAAGDRASALFAVLLALRFAPPAGAAAAAVAVGVALWVALHESGIDPVIAGLAVGLVTSAYPPARDGPRAR